MTHYRIIRQLLGLTIDQMAAKLKVIRKTYISYELGDKKSDTCRIRLIKMMDDLIERDYDKSPRHRATIDHMLKEIKLAG